LVKEGRRRKEEEEEEEEEKETDVHELLHLEHVVISIR